MGFASDSDKREIKQQLIGALTVAAQLSKDINLWIDGNEAQVFFDRVIRHLDPNYCRQ